MKNIKDLYCWFLCDKRAISAIEYALISAFVAIGTIASLEVMGVSVLNTFECISKGITADDGMCVGEAIEFEFDISKGWTSQMEVEEGATYEVIFPSDLKFTIWNDRHKWFNIDENEARHNGIGFGAMISDDSVSGQIISAEGDQDYRKLENFYAAKDDGLNFTANKDGHLSIGIVDINSFDNWLSTDGGNTVSRTAKFTVKRVD